MTIGKPLTKSGRRPHPIRALEVVKVILFGETKK